MKTKTWYSIRAAAEDSAEPTHISIHDEIGAWGVSAKQFLTDLRSIPANKPVHLSLHSPGGEVLDGLAIYNALKARAAITPVNVHIEGLAASMASVIAMAGSSISMPRNAYLMIHNPSGMAWGEASDLRELADLLDKLQGSLLNAYESRTGMDRDDLLDLMNAETWMDGDEAKARGFIDQVTDEVALSASAFDTRRLVNMPANAAKLLTASAEDPPVSETGEQGVAPVPGSDEQPAAPAADENAAPAADPEPEPCISAGEEQQPADPAEPTPEQEPAAFIESAVAAVKRSRTTRAQVEALEASLAQRDSRISELEAAIAQLEPFKAQVEAMRAELAKHEAEQKTLAAAAAEIAASHGLSPEAAAALPSPTSAETLSHLDTYNSISDPAERAAYLKAHKAEIMAEQRRRNA